MRWVGFEREDQRPAAHEVDPQELPAWAEVRFEAPPTDAQLEALAATTLTELCGPFGVVWADADRPLEVDALVRRLRRAVQAVHDIVPVQVAVWPFARRVPDEPGPRWSATGTWPVRPVDPSLPAPGEPDALRRARARLASAEHRRHQRFVAAFGPPSGPVATTDTWPDPHGTPVEVRPVVRLPVWYGEHLLVLLADGRWGMVGQAYNADDTAMQTGRFRWPMVLTQAGPAREVVGRAREALVEQGLDLPFPVVDVALAGLACPGVTDAFWSWVRLAGDEPTVREALARRDEPAAVELLAEWDQRAQDLAGGGFGDAHLDELPPAKSLSKTRPRAKFAERIAKGAFDEDTVRRALALLEEVDAPAGTLAQVRRAYGL
ncbi:MAG: hypothetical protein H6738_03830 [Alphaproteobacteria bacterium]|nr:hypothetical protein [Alphaproteobacteria bacterium]MCB9695899.1 hypothetical protein [Alphaproteobacteria bacterium]